MNTQPTKEIHKEFFSSHVDRAMNTDEQVTNDKRSNQARKEVAGHTSGQQ